MINYYQGNKQSLYPTAKIIIFIRRKNDYEGIVDQPLRELPHEH